MKLSKELEAEIFRHLRIYWESYLQGDIATFQRRLYESYKLFGTAESEVINTSDEAVGWVKEIKAVVQLEDVPLAQILNHLKAYRLEVGLPINFGSKSLTFKPADL